MREKFQRFMIGRYGADELSKMLSGVALGCLILAMFARLYRFLASFTGLGSDLSFIHGTGCFLRMCPSATRRIRSF